MSGRNVSSALGSDRLRNRSRKPFFSLLPFFCLTLLLLFCFTGWVNAKEAKPKLQPWHINGILAALDDSYPKVQGYALGQLAKYDSKDVKVAFKNPEEIAKKAANLLQDRTQDSDMRGNAAQALISLGDAATPYIKDILNFIQDDTQDPDVRVRTAGALGNLEDAATPYIKDILNFIQDKTKNSRVRSSAAKAVGNLGNAATHCIKDILKIIQDKTQDSDVRGSATVALSNLGDAAKPYIKDIAKLLEDEVLEDGELPDKIRSNAAIALGNLGDAAKPYIKDIANFIQDDTKDYNARIDAAIALDKLGDAAKPYIEDIANRLKDNTVDPYVRGVAIAVLGNVGDAAKPYIKDIGTLLKDQTQTSEVRATAALVLSNLGNASTPYIFDVLKFIQGDTKIGYTLGDLDSLFSNLGDAKLYIKDILKIIQDKTQDSNVSGRAAVALGNLEDAAKPYIKDILKIIQDKTQNLYVRHSVAVALGKLEKLSLDNVVSILNVVYEGDSFVNEWRFHTYLLSGGDEDVKRLLQWVGKPKELPAQLTHDPGKKTLEVFEKAWKPSEKLPELRRDLASKIARVTKMVAWQPNDIVLLQGHFNRLKSDKYDEADSIQAVITNLEGWKWVFTVWQTLLAHITFWIALIFFYPKYDWIQAIFFWNPWVRNILGLGYVSFLLTWFPFLRHKLFEPFKTPFLSDAGLSNFNPEAYFPNSDVSLKGTDDRQPITVIFPSIQGQLILEGDSGLGKTMFLRHLLTQSKRIVVYLPATKCAEGVIEAIQKKLHGAKSKTPSFCKA